MFMFPLFHLLRQVIQKLRTTQECEVILIDPWWPSQPCFPHLLRLCVDHPLFFPYRWDLLGPTVTTGICLGCSRTVCMLGGSHAALPNSRIFEDVSRLLAASRRPSMNRIYDDRWLRFAHWAAGQGIDPLSPRAV